MATCPKDFIYFIQQMNKKVAINLNPIKDRGKVNIDLKLSKLFALFRRQTTRRPDNWSTGTTGRQPNSSTQLIDQLIDLPEASLACQEPPKAKLAPVGEMPFSPPLA
jgi:hypothetical protein